MAGDKSLFFIGAFLILYSIQLGNVSAADSAVICYWGSWATYRLSIARFEVSDIDASLCTHVIYEYAGLSDGLIASLDPYNDLVDNYGKGNYEKFTAYAEKNGFKALLGIGGWNEGSEKYSVMASYAQGREKFADSVVAYLKRYGFHGLSLDWEYPTQRGGGSEDKENYVLLLQTLQEKFADDGYILTVGVGAAPNFYSAYDMPNIGKYVDYIILFSFDYYSSTGRVTTVASPLTCDDSLCVDSTVDRWVSAGAPAEKIVISAAAYGRTFHLLNANNHDLGDSSRGPGTAGQFTQEAGLLSYLELCTSEDWTVVHSDDPLYTYAYRGNQWISYDDAENFEAKAKYAAEKSLGGMAIYALEFDDFGGNCGTAYPLLKSIHKGLGRT